MQRSTSLFKSRGTLFQSSAACVCRRPLAVVVERKGELVGVIRVRVVEVAAELHGAIMVIVVVGVGAFQLGEVEARRRTIRFPEFVPIAVRFFAAVRRACESRDRREGRMMINI